MATRVHDPQRVTLNEITDALLIRPDESLGSFYARTGATNRTPTEATVDYLMAKFELPPEQRSRIRHLTSNLVGKLGR